MFLFLAVSVQRLRRRLDAEPAARPSHRPDVEADDPGPPERARHVQSLDPLPLRLDRETSPGPEPIALNKDNCDYCKMTISNIRFATELKTGKGRVYKFDDIACMLNYKKENSNTAAAKFYICDYLTPNALLKADSLFYVSSDAIGSPMGGNIAAFSNSDSAQAYLIRFSAQPLSWAQLNE